MATATRGSFAQGLTARRPAETLTAEAEKGGDGLRRAVGALDLTALGELIAWIIGWDLIIEYGFSVSTIAVGWGGYVKDLLDSLFGLALPDAIALAPGEGGVVNLPAVVLVLGVTAILVLGVRERARTNTAMVAFKVTVLIFFIVVGAFAFHGSHFDDFAPHGTSCVVDAAALSFFAMSRDRLIPQWFGRLNAKKVPSRTLILFGLLSALMAALIPLSELAELVNIGTLFAFVLVNAGVIYLRHSEPDLERGFRTPLVPFVPLIGIALCVYLMTHLAGATWWRFGIWMVVGLVVYFAYGRTHSKVGNPDDEDADGRGGSGPASPNGGGDDARFSREGSVVPTAPSGA
jgi:amino acid transporter